jgi:hypothetical protein
MVDQKEDPMVVLKGVLREDRTVVPMVVLKEDRTEDPQVGRTVVLKEGPMVVPLELWVLLVLKVQKVDRMVQALKVQMVGRLVLVLKVLQVGRLVLVLKVQRVDQLVLVTLEHPLFQLQRLWPQQQIANLQVHSEPLALQLRYFPMEEFLLRLQIDLEMWKVDLPLFLLN